MSKVTGNPQKLHEALLSQIVPAERYRTGDPYEWQRSARTALKEMLRMPVCNTEDCLEIEWEKETETYTEIRFTFESEKGYRPVVHALFPKTTEKVPAMICLQGHSTGMHISIGRPKFPGDEEDIAGDRDFAIQAVRRGFAAFALEQRAFGECGGTEKGPACNQPAYTALLLGRTILGERVFDVMRLIDVINASFADRVDEKHIGITGNSGGGTTSIYAAAVEERISLAAPSCAFSSFYHSIGVIEHCPCNYVPGIAVEFDMGDIAALVAPRPLVICSGKNDTIFPVGQAKEQTEIAKAVYQAMKNEEKLCLVIGPEGHRYYQSLIWPEILKRM